MPTAEFDLSPQQVTEFLQSLTHETRWRVLKEANAHLDWSNFDRVELEELSIEDTEAGKKPGFICPHCNDTFKAHTLTVVDMAFSQRGLTEVNYDHQIVKTFVEYDIDDVHFEHAVLLCPLCEEPVALPHRWDHEHAD